MEDCFVYFLTNNNVISWVSRSENNFPKALPCRCSKLCWYNKPSKHFFFFKTSWRRSNFSSSKTYSRRLQDVFRKMSWRRIQNVFKMSSRRVCKTSSSRYVQDIFKKTSCKHVLKTPWKTKKIYAEEIYKTSSTHLQRVFTKTYVCWERLTRNWNIQIS